MSITSDDSLMSPAYLPMLYLVRRLDFSTPEAREKFFAATPDLRLAQPMWPYGDGDIPRSDYVGVYA